MPGESFADLGDENQKDAIVDLGPKLDLLERPRKTLANKVGINDNTLKSYMSRTPMPRDEQQKIGATYGFSIEHLAWREGSVSDFRKYLSSLTKPALALVAEAPKAVDEDFAKIRLAGVNATQMQNQQEQGLAVFDQGDFEPCDIGAGITVGLSRFRVELTLPARPGVDMKRSENARRGNRVRIDARGTDDKPKFDYVAEPAPLQGRWPEEEELGRLRGLESGDEIAVVTQVHLEDAFVDATGAELDNVWKVKLCDALARNEILGRPDKRGWAPLCLQKIRVVGQK